MRRVLFIAGLFLKIPVGIWFLLYYVGEVILANFQVAYEVLTPGFHSTPGIVAVPLDASKDGEINLLANLITMTPGTMSMDISTDKKTLYVYGMHVKDPEEFQKRIKQKLERKVIRLFR